MVHCIDPLLPTLIELTTLSTASDLIRCSGTAGTDSIMTEPPQGLARD